MTTTRTCAASPSETSTNFYFEIPGQPTVAGKYAIVPGDQGHNPTGSTQATVGFESTTNCKQGAFDYATSGTLNAPICSSDAGLVRSVCA